MQNVNLTTTVKMVSYKTDKAGRIMLSCPLMDARVVHNTTCIKEIDATLEYSTSLMTQNHRAELAQRRQQFVDANISLYRSAGW